MNLYEGVYIQKKYVVMRKCSLGKQRLGDSDKHFATIYDCHKINASLYL